MVDNYVLEKIVMRKIVLDSVIRSADLHANRLTSILLYLRPIIPLNANKFMDLEDGHYAYIDSFVYRFTKLQDLMGSKLFGLILDWAEEGPYPSFLDKLHALEKLGCITDAQSWINVREMRNFLSHDYPDDYERIASFFNQAYELAPFLMLTLDNLKKYSEETTKRKGEFLRNDG